MQSLEVKLFKIRRYYYVHVHCPVQKNVTLGVLARKLVVQSVQRFSMKVS